MYILIKYYRSFIETIKWTYPFKTVNGLTINWDVIEENAETAFKILSKRRMLVDSTYTNNTISLRYDWRALLAVIRAFLPKSESLVGVTTQGIVHKFYGIFSDEMYADTEDWPLNTCYVAGGNINYCSGEYITK